MYIKKEKILLFSLLFAVFLAGCGPSFKTEKLEMPKALNRGALSINVKPGEGITSAHISRVKELLRRSFQEAGYDKISFNKTGTDRGRVLNIVITRFEHDSSSNNTATAVGVGCAYVCILAAPCLLLPGYNNPRFDISAEVTGYDNGHEVFSDTVAERASGSSNAFERGDEEFMEKLEAMAVHNFAAAVIRQMNRN